MRRTGTGRKSILALALAGLLAGGAAMAEKPSWAGGGKSDRDGRPEQRENQKGDRRESQKGERRDAGENRPHGNAGREHFEERHRGMAREYYSEHYRGGRCPPGLAKKHNGCMPPGQARKWQVGQPLARDVVYYQVPPQLVIQFGQPPTGYRYVRVASDILLIAIGTGMVVDAIRDLGRS